jgi:xanthine dehydrogenase small subunit
MGDFPAPGRLEHAAADRRQQAMGSGSDWFVRHPHPEGRRRLSFLDHDPALRHIEAAAGGLEIGAGVAWRDFFEHPLVRALLPDLAGVEARLASAPIRNRATVAGNLVNASPIADLACLFLALDARLRLRYAHSVRELPLDKFFLDYKKTALRPGEIVEAIRLPPGDGAISFEKVGKRAHLDIATVNSAAWLRLEGGRVAACRISAGGVAPVPLRLTEAEAWLTGRQLDAAAVRRAADLAMAAARPIDDVRGSADYRRRLLGRLVCVHFARLAPEAGLAEEFWP